MRSRVREDERDAEVRRLRLVIREAANALARMRGGTGSASPVPTLDAVIRFLRCEGNPE